MLAKANSIGSLLLAHFHEQPRSDRDSPLLLPRVFNALGSSSYACSMSNGWPNALHTRERVRFMSIPLLFSSFFLSALCWEYGWSPHHGSYRIGGRSSTAVGIYQVPPPLSSAPKSHSHSVTPAQSNSRIIIPVTH